MKLREYLGENKDYPKGLSSLSKKDFDREKPPVQKLIRKASDGGMRDIRLTRSFGSVGWSGVVPIKTAIGMVLGTKRTRI